MSTAEAEVALSAFFDRVRRARSRILMLDYDGTLAPFRIERDQARPYPGVGDILRAIIADGFTRLVVVSGRAIADLRPLLGLEPPPELWGSHGWEHLSGNGQYRLIAVEPAAAETLARARETVVSLGLVDRLESKPVSVAVHWRGLTPAVAQAVQACVVPAWSALLGHAALELHWFDGGIELRPLGRDKGAAVQAVLGGAAQPVAVAYLGDDQTDEDAFRAMHGQGLCVLVRDAPRASLAELHLRPPEGLLGFLAAWREAASAPADAPPDGA